MRYFATIALGFLLSVAVLLAVFSASLGFSSSANALSIGAWYSVKEEALEARKGGGRIVLLGGSSGLYGVRMANVEAALGRPAVNFAVHAGLPVAYLLHRAKQLLVPGDIVVLALEYEFYHPTEESDIYVDFVLGEDPEYLNAVSSQEKVRWLLGAQGLTLMNSVKRWMPAAQKESDEVRKNSRAKLNSQGDIVANDLAKRSKARARALESVEDLVSCRVSLTYSDEAWEDLVVFVKWCDEHDVTLFVTFPPTVFFPVYDSPAYAARFEELVKKWESLGVTVLGTPRDMMLPREKFYDTVYHLNSDGMSENTQRFVDWIRPLLPTGEPTR
ncbi:MAG: hypothetical protein ACOVMP_09565 [Chthoniobacterales bacterium]